MRYTILFFALIIFAAPVFSQKIGAPAPAFNVVSIDGKSFDSANLKGKVVVLNLWFVNCPNCVEEIKLLNQIVDEYKNRDVVFIGMATNDKAALEKFLRKNPFKYNIVPKATLNILSFGVPDKKGEINMPFPGHIVIDRAGKIVVNTSGTKGVEAVKSELARQFSANGAKTK